MRVIQTCSGLTIIIGGEKQMGLMNFIYGLLEMCDLPVNCERVDDQRDLSYGNNPANAFDENEY
jgi:hypothetical protein